MEKSCFLIAPRPHLEKKLVTLINHVSGQILAQSGKTWYNTNKKGRQNLAKPALIDRGYYTRFEAPVQFKQPNIAFDNATVFWYNQAHVFLGYVSSCSNATMLCPFGQCSLLDSAVISLPRRSWPLTAFSSIVYPSRRAFGMLKERVALWNKLHPE
jgi:hypothetical protein